MNNNHCHIHTAELIIDSIEELTPLLTKKQTDRIVTSLNETISSHQQCSHCDENNSLTKDMLLILKEANSCAIRNHKNFLRGLTPNEDNLHL